MDVKTVKWLYLYKKDYGIFKKVLWFIGNWNG
jgi:hypothetical protein